MIYILYVDNRYVILIYAQGEHLDESSNFPETFRPGCCILFPARARLCVTRHCVTLLYYRYNNYIIYYGGCADCEELSPIVHNNNNNNNFNIKRCDAWKERDGGGGGECPTARHVRCVTLPPSSS